MILSVTGFSAMHTAHARAAGSMLPEHLNFTPPHTTLIVSVLQNAKETPFPHVHPCRNVIAAIARAFPVPFFLRTSTSTQR
jgi:hypothetical protein